MPTSQTRIGCIESICYKIVLMLRYNSYYVYFSLKDHSKNIKHYFLKNNNSNHKILTPF